MADQWWFALAAYAGLLGFQNLEAARGQRSSSPAMLLFSFTAGWLAYSYGDELWMRGDDHSRVVVVALSFPMVSLVLGILYRCREFLAVVLIWLVVVVTGFVLATSFGFQPISALACGLLGGIVVFLPWGSWLQRYRARRARRREERQRQEQKQKELDRQRQLEQQQDDLLQALVDEMRK